MRAIVMPGHNISNISQHLFLWLAQWCQGNSKQTPAIMSNWSDREWKIAKAVIIVHGMGPTLGYLLNQQGDHPALPQHINDYLRDQFSENTKRIQMIANAKQQITDVLSKHNIDYLCFKGLTLAEQLYSHRGMRPMADIDIYTGKHSQTLLERALIELDFQPHVITHEGMTLYPMKWSETNLDEISWAGASITVDTSDSIWYQGESTQLPFAIDVHFSMQQGIQEFRYDIDGMFQQALISGDDLTPEQTYIHLLLHASKHFRGRCARWIQLYDLHLFPQKLAFDEEKVLAIAKKHQICHLLLWPLLLTRQTFKSSPSWLEIQLLKHTSWRYQWLFNRHNLTDLSHCNPKDISLFYSLLWTQNVTSIVQWLALSSQASTTYSKYDNQQLTRSPPMIKRIIARIRRHFNINTRQQWQIFAAQGLDPIKDWD